MKKQFLPTDRDGRLFRLSEECAEVIFEIAKAGRFGFHNRYPADGATNAEKILQEIRDLQDAIEAARPELEAMCGPKHRIAAEIAAERRRQIEVEGFDASHDATHDGGDLLHAAVIYLAHATGRAYYRQDGTPFGWPWQRQWWKPKTPRRDLIRAGALCFAERERIIRLYQRSFNGSDRRPQAAGPVFADGPYVWHVEQKLLLIVEEIERLDQAGAA